MTDAVLPSPFESLRQRLATGVEPYGANALSAFAAALANESAFDLSRLETLHEADRSLFEAIFCYCLEFGLTEDERALVAATFTDASCVSGEAS